MFEVTFIKHPFFLYITNSWTVNYYFFIIIPPCLYLPFFFYIHIFFGGKQVLTTAFNIILIETKRSRNTSQKLSFHLFPFFDKKKMATTVTLDSRHDNNALTNEFLSLSLEGELFFSKNLSIIIIITNN